MKKLILLTFAFLFVLASCDDEPSFTNTRSFIGGDTGISVDFVEGEPPLDVTDGGATPFTVTVMLENEGETKVLAEDVILTLRGIDAITFGLASSDDLITSPTEDLEENDINPDTGEAINSPPVFVTFPQLNFEGELSGNSDFPFVVDVCYKYTSLATSKLCIKEDLQDSSDDVCTVFGPKDVQNSGSPVQITGFKEFSAGANAVSFSFDVKNVGGGLLAQNGFGCDQDFVYKDFVRITVDTGLPDLTCSGTSNPSTDGTAFSGDIKLTIGKRQVRCTQQLRESDKTDKIMIVDFNVDYDYQVSRQISVLVKHI